MQAHYFPGIPKPEHIAPVFDYIPYTTLPDIREWCAENWGEQQSGHCIMPRLVDWIRKDKDGNFVRWEQGRTSNLICNERGTVTVESVADAIMKGDLYGPLLDEFKYICREIDSLGYEVKIVGGDIEFKLNTHWEHYGESGLPGADDSFSLGYVLFHLMNNGYGAGLPDLDYNFIIDPANQYKKGNEHLYNTRRCYDEWQISKNSFSFDRVFGITARETFGSDTVVCNYAMSSYQRHRPRHPAQYEANAPVGRYSSPPLYIGYGYYGTMNAAKAGLRCCSSSPKDTIPWIEGRYANEWFPFLEKRGHKHVLVWSPANKNST